MAKTETKMNFYRSLYDLAGLVPSERGRQRLLTAMLDYFFEGSEPEGLTKKEAVAFEAIRGRIEASRTNSSNRKGSGGGDSGDESANGTANEAHNETPDETRDETSNETRSSDAPSDGDSLLSPSLKGFRNSRDEVDSQGLEPPTAEEVRNYFAANCLRGDPDDFWATYESQGWVKGNGQPVTDWRPLAQKWSRTQIQRDHDRAERGRSGPREAAAAKPLPKPVNSPDETLDADIEAFRARWGEDPC